MLKFSRLQLVDSCCRVVTSLNDRKTQIKTPVLLVGAAVALSACEHEQADQKARWICTAAPASASAVGRRNGGTTQRPLQRDRDRQRWALSGVRASLTAKPMNSIPSRSHMRYEIGALANVPLSNTHARLVRGDEMNKLTKTILSGVVAVVAVVPLASSAQGMMGMSDQIGSMPMMRCDPGGMPIHGMSMMRGDQTGMPMMNRQQGNAAPMMGGNQVNMPMMQQRKARMQEHMQKMDAHMAATEDLLRQLVELQKQE